MTGTINEWMFDNKPPDITFDELEIGKEYVFMLKDITLRIEGFRPEYICFQATILEGEIVGCNRQKMILHLSERCFMTAWNKTINFELDKKKSYDMVVRLSRTNKKVLKIIDSVISQRLTHDQINSVLNGGNKLSG